MKLHTLELAGYFFVLTNLPPGISAESVLQLYRLRWQIEMKFKTLKSVLHLDEVPARTDQSLRVYVLAKLLVAILIDSLLDEAESFSPWGYLSRPISNWRMTRLLLDVVIAAIKPVLALIAIERALRAQSRHLVLSKRKRIYQRACARFLCGGLS